MRLKTCDGCGRPLRRAHWTARGRDQAPELPCDFDGCSEDCLDSLVDRVQLAFFREAAAPRPRVVS